MSTKTAFRVIRDSKHIGTVTRDSVATVVRTLKEEHDAGRSSKTGSTQPSKTGNGSSHGTH